MAAFGVVADVSATDDALEPDYYTIDAEYWSSVAWFASHESALWRSGLNGIESLDYQQIQAAFALEAVDDPQTLFADLRHIERGVLAGLRSLRAETAEQPKEST